MSVDFEDFQELEMRVGKVVECSVHPDADNLLLLQVDVGESEPRQLVAGLRDDYTAEELVDQLIVVVTNLEPATIRGEESRGMLLAADAEEKVSVLEPDSEVRAGTLVR